ncbi:MAG: hypothetical protein LBJ59_04650 [Zoogloeaceae bacterium]|nr:hypothetical protein [Zoogloeaceae bacterium]
MPKTLPETVLLMVMSGVCPKTGAAARSDRTASVSLQLSCGGGGGGG